MPDYYRILEVDPQASKEVIEKAYKALSLKYHPDKNTDKSKKDTAQKWMEIRKAYEILSDDKKRAAYDGARKQEMWDIFLNNGIIGLAKKYLR